MTKMIRRQALRSIGGGSLAALLLSGSEAPGAIKDTDQTQGTALVQGTLTLEHADGRRMSGFIETGIHGGIAFCSLVRQDDGNPAIESVFAAPERSQGAEGVRVTVSLYTEPVGDVTFSLLHVAAQTTDTPERIA